MGITDLFWAFIIFSALQPLIKQRMLDAARQHLIAKIEKERGSRVIILIHRQETMSLLGFPILRYIDVNDSEEVIHAIQLTDPEVPLDIVLHTPGGLVLASLQIACAIKKRKGKVTAHVPHYAMSGGTLIALAADEIVMGEHAVLGPVDPQLGEFPAASLLKVVQNKPIEEIDDKTLILADQAEKAIKQVRTCVRGLLDGYDEEQAGKIADLLTEGRWTHDYPIMFDEAVQIGLHVRSDLPDDIMRLMTLFPQPVRRNPSVEYLPAPRKAGRTPRRTAG